MYNHLKQWTVDVMMGKEKNMENDLLVIINWKFIFIGFDVGQTVLKSRTDVGEEKLQSINEML